MDETLKIEYANETFAEAIRMMKTSAHDNSRCSTSVATMLFCHSCKTVSKYITFIPPHSDDVLLKFRRNFKTFLQKFIECGNCGEQGEMIGYILTYGGWYLSLPTKDVQWYVGNREVKHHPDRKECVIMTLFTKFGRHKFRMFDVRRYKKGKKKYKIRELVLVRDASLDEIKNGESAWNIYDAETQKELQRGQDS